MVWARDIYLTAKQNNELMIRWAHKYNCIVFNVDYRSAPETNAAGSAKDFMHTFLHVHDNAEKYNIDKSKIVIAGDGGGGYVCI